MRGICVFREIDRRESRVFYEENLLSLFKSSQSQSYLIYSQSKVKAKLIYIMLLFVIVFCHLSIFVLCLSAVSSGFGLVSVMPELRLRIYCLHYLIEFMLFSILALNCFIWQVWRNCASFVTEICYWVIMILR